MVDESPLDRDRIIECLSRHRVEYLLVGGIGAQMHGATRPTREGGRANFEELATRAERVEIGDVVVMVAGLDDIIASKEWANRPKDRKALVELRELRGR